MIFDITLLQYHLFKNIEQRVKGLPYRAAPSIRPASNMFSGLTVGFETYVKFIQSTFRVDLDGQVYYFFFRNCLNKNDRSFTWPSSCEVVHIQNGSSVSLFKYHYFNDSKYAPDSVILKNHYSPEYNDYDEIKQDIKVISNFLADEFAKCI